MKKQQRQSGFTMIELMVVLLIASTVIALVGSLTIDRVEKTQARSETMGLQNAIRGLAYRAFVASEQHQLYFEGKAVKIYVNKQLYDTFVYQHLFFQPQTIVLNTMGFPEQTSLNILENDKNIQLDMKSLFQAATTDNISNNIRTGDESG